MRARYAVLLVFAVGVAICGQQTAFGSLTLSEGEWVVITAGGGSVSSGEGGEFRVDVYSSTTWGSSGQTGVPAWNGTGTTPSQVPSAADYQGTFFTFCASTQLYFVSGDAYQIKTGGEGIKPASISNLGAALFEAYATNDQVSNSNTISPPDYYVPGHNELAAYPSINGYNSTAIAGSIQTTIWNGLNPSLGLSSYESDAGINDTTYQAILSEFSWASLPGISEDTPVVDQINLYAPQNNYGYGNSYPGGQPQMYYPEGGGNAQIPPVPEPVSALVWSLLGAASWLGMRFVRR
jgi:hypothetical protein